MSSQFEAQQDFDETCDSCGGRILRRQLVSVYGDEIRHVFCTPPEFADPSAWFANQAKETANH